MWMIDGMALPNGVCKNRKSVYHTIVSDLHADRRWDLCLSTKKAGGIPEARSSTSLTGGVPDILHPHITISRFFENCGLRLVLYVPSLGIESKQCSKSFRCLIHIPSTSCSCSDDYYRVSDVCVITISGPLDELRTFLHCYVNARNIIPFSLPGKTPT